MLFRSDGICVIGHGSSKALSVLSALRLAHSAASHHVMDDLHALGEQETSGAGLGAAGAASASTCG